MSPGRIAAHVVILLYLTVTASAFIFTMTKHTPPGVPYQVVHWSYGMMAPYQGDTAWNADLRVEGLRPDGTWESVDIDRYYPYGDGEKNVRKFLRMYAGRGPFGHRAKFTELALQVLDRERAQGKDFEALRMFFDYWPRSPMGYQALHLPAFTDSEYITEVR